MVEAFRLARAERDRIHIVNGIWAESAFAAALAALSLSGSRFLIHSEAPEPGERRSLARRSLRSGFGRWVARHAAGVLAISRLAETFYRDLGFTDASLYPFGYFRRLTRDSVAVAEAVDQARLDILFVGQLVRRKGVDLLLDAILPLWAEYPALSLTLIGEGSERAALESQAAASGFRDRITFAGARPADDVRTRLMAADLLVLPSRWDGWGMVVNEALAAGVPAIVSTHCGAGDLIHTGINGYVFDSEDVQGLRDGLRRFCNQSSEERLAMRCAARVTGESVDADIAARYLIACLQHVTGMVPDKPMAPWLAPSRLEAKG
jgi:glycosyltransferase involved in cell wall biosynthesis